MKKPYQIRIETGQLVKLKQLAEKNETGVNHEIRQAIRKHLQDNTDTEPTKGL